MSSTKSQCNDDIDGVDVMMVASNMKLLLVSVFVCIPTPTTPTPQPLSTRNPQKGVSHLASVRIVGNKGYPRRGQSLFKGGKVQNDVNLLSYYLKNRKAAAENETAPLNLASGTMRASKRCD